jgi:hypothetical protein
VWQRRKWYRVMCVGCRSRNLCHSGVLYIRTCASFVVWPVVTDMRCCAGQTRRGPAKARGKTRRRSPPRRKQRRRTSQRIRRNGKQRSPQRKVLRAVTPRVRMETATVATGPRRAPRRRRGRPSLRSARGSAICWGCRATTHAIRYPPTTSTVLECDCIARPELTASCFSRIYNVCLMAVRECCMLISLASYVYPTHAYLYYASPLCVLRVGGGQDVGVYPRPQPAEPRGQAPGAPGRGPAERVQSQDLHDLHDEQAHLRPDDT